MFFYMLELLAEMHIVNFDFQKYSSFKGLFIQKGQTWKFWKVLDKVVRKGFCVVIDREE